MAGEDSFIYKTERPWPNPRLTIASIVGHTTATSTRLWFRTAGLGQFTVLLYSWPGSAGNDTVFTSFKAIPFAVAGVGAEVRRVPFEVADWEADSTYVVDISGLEADTTYRYALYWEGDGGRIILGQDRPLSFRTMPSTVGPLSFAFYSCHRPYKIDKPLLGGPARTTIVNMAMWDVLRAALDRKREGDLRFVLAGGDQAYVDTVDSLDIWKFLNKVMRRQSGTLVPDVAEMVTWYRDIYRGYWGFPSVRRVFSDYPTYMVWDDHEICDGWGSYRLEPEAKSEIGVLLPDLAAKGLSFNDGLELVRRMFNAATQAYSAYEHAHNPVTPSGQFDYSFEVGDCGFYVLDGRGQRDLARPAWRISGQEQFERFKAWIESTSCRYLFVVTAVPMLHLRPALANADNIQLVKTAKLSDDLRDSWEHHEHRAERREFLKLLLAAARAKKRVCVLSGDVHIAAAFRISDGNGHSIYQLTSSAMTYSQSRLLGWLLARGTPEEGELDGGLSFERRALYTDSNFAIQRGDPARDRVEFCLHGEQSVPAPDDADLALLKNARHEAVEQAVSSAIAKVPLEF